MKKNLSSFQVLTLSLVMILGFSNTLSAQYAGTGEFTKITALQDLTDGYYVIAYGSTFAMNNTHNGTFFAHTAISPVSDVITDPSSAIVWKIETNGSYKTIYNEGTQVYVSYSGSGNNVQATNPAPLTNAEMWTATYESNLFHIQSVNVSGRNLQFNSNSGQERFACYSSNQNYLTLYKLTPPEECAILEDFEETTPWTGMGYGSYAKRTVTDSWGQWTVAAVTQMTAGSDRYNGLRSARFRGNTSDTGDALNRVEMAFDHYGIKKVSFEYASYGTHSGGIINLESSIDQGVSWNNVGTVTAGLWTSDGWKTAEFNVNITGNARIRITKNSQSSSTSVNIDDICIVDYGEANIVKNPTFTPANGIYDKPQNVTIECATEGAAIHYTTDGTTPTSLSTLYTAPIPLTTTGTYTIKAIAIKAGMDNSDVATANYTIHIYPPFDCDFSENFETMTGSGSYGGADVTFASGIWRVVGYTIMDDSDRRNGNRSVRLRGNPNSLGDDSCHVTMKFDKPEGIGTFKFRYGSYGAHANGQISSFYSTDHGTNWTLIESFNAPSWIAGGSILQEKEYTLNIAGDVRIKIARDGDLAQNTAVNIDDICITDFNSNIVKTPTFTPGTGNYYTLQNVAITCATEGATIRYTTDGTEPTASSPVYSAPIPVSTTTTIKAIGIKAGMDNSATATATYTFPIGVPNIAAFKAANTATSSVWYKITGDVTFVYKTGRYFYVKDATGGLTVYDNTTPVITNTYNNGDIISGGIIGTCTMYGGLCEFIPVVNFAPGTPGTPVVPITLTMADLLANFMTYESQLVKLDKVAFDAGTFGTGTNGNIPIHQNANEMFCRNNYGNITGYVTEPTKFFDVTGFAIPYNADRQIAPRNLNDIQKVQYTITLSATTGGTVSGGGLKDCGDEITVSATPNTGYHFVNWTEGGTQVSTNANYTFTVTEARTLVANFEINTYTITVSATTGGSATGGGNYTHGQSVTLTATENTGYHFVNWTEGSTVLGTVLTLTFTAEANRTIVANFAINSYNIAVSANPGGGGTVSGGGSYNHFSTATVIATPSTGYNFINWTEGSTVVGTNLSYSFTVTGPRTLVANFEIIKFNIAASAGTGGTISPSGNVSADYGSTPTFTITPSNGYHIQNIFIDNYPINYTVTPEDSDPHNYIFDPVVASHTIHTTFALNCYALNPGNIPGAGGTITMSPTGCVQHGQPVTFTITTDCYQISQLWVGGVSQGTNLGYSFVTQPITATGKLPLIVVNTQIDKYFLTATPAYDPHGSIYPAGVAQVDCGSSQKYEFETDFGYRVKNLFIDGVSVSVPVTNSYTFNNVRENHAIHVEFEEYPQVIIQFGPNAAQGLGGSVFPTYQPNAVNYIAVDSGTVAYPFSIVPEAGYLIEYVYVDGVNNPAAALTGTYVFDYLHINHTIFATFKPIMFTIAATANQYGNITPNGAVPVPFGSNQTFQTVPNYGHHITAVLVDGEIDPTATSTGIYTFYNVTEDHTISAFFAPDTYIITATSGANGDITPAGDIVVEHGINQTFNFIPIQGYEVAQVLIDGLENPAAAQAGFFTFTDINQGHTIHVTFTIQTFTITTTYSPGGTVYPAGVEIVEYNNHSMIYVFNPDPGYIVKYVYVDGTNNPLAVQNMEHRFLNVMANHTLYVVFAKDSYMITATATKGGAINPGGEVIVPTGADKTFYFSPEAGYALVRVIIDGINNSEAVQAGYYTFTEVANDHSITAQFEKKMYEIILPDPNLGAIAIPVGGSGSPVEYGGMFTFVVELLEGYTQSSITVRINSIVILPVGGVFTISNITVDQYVTVDGLELNTYKIIAKSYTGGMIKPAGIFMVTHGESKTFEMVPNAGYKVSDIVVNGESEGAVEVYTFHNIRTDGTIDAYFQYTGVGIADPEGIINVFSHHNVITIENKELVQIKQVEIMDMLGRTLWTGQANGDRTEIILNAAKGIYAVRITTDASQQIVAKVNIY